MQILDRRFGCTISVHLRSTNRLHRELIPTAALKKFYFKNDGTEIKNFYCNLHSKLLEDGIMHIYFSIILGRSLLKKITEIKVRITEAQAAIAEKKLSN